MAAAASPAVTPGATDGRTDDIDAGAGAVVRSAKSGGATTTFALNGPWSRSKRQGRKWKISWIAPQSHKGVISVVLRLDLAFFASTLVHQGLILSYAALEYLCLSRIQLKLKTMRI